MRPLGRIILKATIAAYLAKMLNVDFVPFYASMYFLASMSQLVTKWWPIEADKEA